MRSLTIRFTFISLLGVLLLATAPTTTFAAMISSHGAAPIFHQSNQLLPLDLTGLTSFADIAESPSNVNGRNALYIASTDGNADGNGNHHIVIGSSTTGNDQDFSNFVTLTDFTDKFLGPSLWNFNGHLYVAWKGATNNLIFLGWFNGTSTLQGRITIKNNNGVAQTTSARPTLAAYNGRLYVAWRGTDANGKINLISSSDGVNFGSVTTFSDTTACFDYCTSPFIAPMTFSGQSSRLYVAWMSSGSGNGRIVVGYFDSAHPSSSLQGHTVLSDTTRATPALMSYGSQLWLGWLGTDFFRSCNVASSTNGSSFSNNRGDPCGGSPDEENSGPGFGMFNGHLYYGDDDTNGNIGSSKVR